MAIARIDHDYVYHAATSAVSQALDLGTGSDRALLAFTTCPDGQTVSGASIGGSEALTELASGTSGAGNYHRWYLYGKAGVTATGSQTVTFAGSGTGLKYGYLASYSGVGSIRGGVVGSNESTGYSTGPKLTVTTVSGDLVVELGHDGGRGTTLTPTSPATAFVTVSEHAMEETASGTSTEIDGSLSVGGAWMSGAAALVPAGGGGGSNVPLNILVPTQGIFLANSHGR